MRPLRALLLGFAVATLSVIACMMLLNTGIQHAFVGDASTPPTPGVVLSQAEMDAKEKAAEAAYAAALEQVRDVGVVNLMLADVAWYFAAVGPLTLLGSAWILGKVHWFDVFVFALPVAAGMQFFGARPHGVLLLVAALVLLLMLSRGARVVGTSDA